MGKVASLRAAQRGAHRLEDPSEEADDHPAMTSSA
jgi:hypothetical protein